MYADVTPVPVIDAHVHVFPENISQAICHWFETHAWKFHHKGGVEELVRLQFDNGAAGLVLMGYAHRPGVAREINAFIGGLLQRFPHTAGLAAVHPEDDRPGDVMKQAREEFGLCGVKMHCHVLRRPPDDPSLFPIYEDLEQHNGILNIHAGKEPAIEAYGLDVRSICGASRVENVLRRFPDLRMIIPHLGFDEIDRFYSMLEIFPHLHLDTTMMLGGYFNVSVDREKLVRHADRILYGTDYPHIPYDMETEVRALVEMDPGEEALRKILFENAARLFPITPLLPQ